MVSEEHPKAGTRSPGALLKTGREAAGMSVEQVADKLHLLKSIISSLEKDCYDRVRGDTFARGYLRNYANLLGMDADEIVGCFNAARGVVARPEPKMARRREPFGGGRGAGRIGMVAALLALSGAFLFQTREPVSPAVSLAAQEHVAVETARIEQLQSATPVQAYLSRAN